MANKWLKIHPVKIVGSTEKAYRIVVGPLEDIQWIPKSQSKTEDGYITSVSELYKDSKLFNFSPTDDHPIFKTKQQDKIPLGKEVSNLTVQVSKTDEKHYTSCKVTTKSGQKVERKLYVRKTGTLKGNYLFNFKKGVYRFAHKEIDEKGFASKVYFLGSYGDDGRTFNSVVDSFEKEPQLIEEPSETIELEEEEEEIDFTKPVKHKEFETIKICVGNSIPVYLYGPAGSGKNHTLQQIAEELDLDFYFTNSIQQEYKLTGFKDAGGNYHETEFYKAFTNGGLFFLDEMDASIPEVLVLLNAAIANGYFEFPNGKVTAHEDFRVVAAGNTVGNGADEQYTGRLVLDQATLDRFVAIEFDYDNNIELYLAKGNKELVTFIQELRKECYNKGIRTTFSYRCISSVSTLEKALPLIKVIQIAVLKGLDKDTINTIQCPYGANKYWRILEDYKKAI